MGLPSIFQLPTRTRKPSEAALVRQDLKSSGFSTNSLFSLCCQISGPIKMYLLLNFLAIAGALVAITVWIPPTLLHTSQLVSNT